MSKPRLPLFLLAGALLVAPLLVAPAAQAWPNGPDEDPRLDPPNDPGFAGQWNLWSYVPEEWTQTPGFRTEEIAMGTGISADRAWQVTTGDRRVIVAVLDSGAYWDNRDLVNKYYLNRGELAACKPTPLATPPEGADDFDVDGSGWFDIRDYYAAAGSEADALAEWDVNGNGMLDPQDLIQKCSDGVDDDGNGYVDDISGWDFFQGDNDAYDDNHFGHGNGEARDSTAEGDNGIGDIGVCPNCSTLMVRVGDSFVTDANDFAHGAVFAVDSGASVIQEALGTINNTPFSKRAIDYAYDNNVVVIASAADELAYHHNFPGTNNHTVYVHAIQFDGSSPSNSTTFLNFNNCTNYGMQLLLSTPGTGCSSEATGITSGHAGLIYSAALQANLDPPLSAEECKQLLSMNVDDIAVNPLNNDPTKFPSDVGWDFHFGYGRNNARKTVDAVVQGHIPPEVDITGPAWFQVLYPDRTPSVDITGRINVRRDGQAARYDSVTWKLQYAVGVRPFEQDWIDIDSGTTDGLEGKLATWDLTQVAVDLDAARTDPHQAAVTIRLQAWGQAADGETILGEQRKGFLFDRDPDLLPAFPIALGGSGESSPLFADLDGDGAEELIVPLASGVIHAYKPDGAELSGFPVQTGLRLSLDPDNPLNGRGACAFRDDKTGCIAQVGSMTPDVHQTMMLAPAVGDLDGDDRLELVITTWDGWVFVYDVDGSQRPGWPQHVDWDFTKVRDRDHIYDSGFMASPVLYDMDGDGKLEIIAAAMDQHIYIWHDDGSPMAPYPVRVGSEPAETSGERIVCTPAVGDADGDGLPEIAVGTNEALGANDAQNEALAYVLEGETGEVKDGWPQSVYGLMVNVLPVIGKGIPTNPIMADLDYDGLLEISFDTVSTQGWIFRVDGSIYKKMNNRDFGELSDSADSPAYILLNNGAMGYIDPEGGVDFVKGTAGFDFALAFAGGGQLPEERLPNGNAFDHQLSGWDTDTGTYLEGFPRVMEDWQFFNTPTIVDIDNDNNPEVLIGSGGYFVHAFNYKGEEPAGWPKQTGGWIIASAAVGDFNGDGLFEVAITTRDGWLYVWKTPGEAATSIYEWNGFGHDPHNTNNYETDPVPYRTWTKGSTPGPEPQPEAAGDTGTEPDAGSTTGPDASEETDAGSTPPKKDDGGCGAAPGSGAQGLLGLLLALIAGAWVLRRRGALG